MVEFLVSNPKITGIIGFLFFGLASYYFNVSAHIIRNDNNIAKSFKTFFVWFFNIFKFVAALLSAMCFYQFLTLL